MCVALCRSSLLARKKIFWQQVWPAALLLSVGGHSASLYAWCGGWSCLRSQGRFPLACKSCEIHGATRCERNLSQTAKFILIIVNYLSLFLQVRKKDQINIESKLKTVRFIGELVKFLMFPKSECLHCLKVRAIRVFLRHCGFFSTSGLAVDSVQKAKFWCAAHERQICQVCVFTYGGSFARLFVLIFVSSPTVVRALQMLLFDFSHHNIEMACALLDTCGRFLYRSADSHHRTKVYLVTFVFTVHISPSVFELLSCSWTPNAPTEKVFCLLHAKDLSLFSVLCFGFLKKKWTVHFPQDLMMRKKAALHLDGRYNTMIENAYYYCNPPEVSREVKKERPPMHQYIRRLLYKDLSKITTEKVRFCFPLPIALWSAPRKKRKKLEQRHMHGKKAKAWDCWWNVLKGLETIARCAYFMNN